MQFATLSQPHLLRILGKSCPCTPLRFLACLSTTCIGRWCGQGQKAKHWVQMKNCMTWGQISILKQWVLQLTMGSVQINKSIFKPFNVHRPYNQILQRVCIWFVTLSSNVIGYLEVSLKRAYSCFSTPGSSSACLL